MARVRGVMQASIASAEMFRLCPPFDVRKDRRGPGIADGVGGGHKGQGGDDGFGAGSQPGRHAGQVQGGRGVGHGDGMPGVDVVGQLALELLRDGAHGQPLAADDLQDGLFFLGAKVNIGEWDVPFHLLSFSFLLPHLIVYVAADLRWSSRRCSLRQYREPKVRFKQLHNLKSSYCFDGVVVYDRPPQLTLRATRPRG